MNAKIILAALAAVCCVQTIAAASLARPLPWEDKINAREVSDVDVEQVLDTLEAMVDELEEESGLDLNVDVTALRKVHAPRNIISCGASIVNLVRTLGQVKNLVGEFHHNKVKLAEDKKACSLVPTTAAPATTEQPASTAAPASTEQPASTEAPASSEQPASTAAPASTEQPSSTAAPASTEQPSTAAPASTEQPSTAAPASTEQPASTAAPASTEQPSTAAPASTEQPSTAAPASTEQPSTEAPATSTAAPKLHVADAVDDCIAKANADFKIANKKSKAKVFPLALKVVTGVVSLKSCFSLF